MSALDDILQTPAPLTRELAFALLSNARSAYYAVAESKLSQIEVLTLGMGAHGELSRFDTAYQTAQYTNDFFVDEISWNYAQQATRDLAGLAGVVGTEGVDTAKKTVAQLGTDLVDEANKVKTQIEDEIETGLPWLVVGLVALAVIVVLK